jgi:hypothetical protein
MVEDDVVIYDERLFKYYKYRRYHGSLIIALAVAYLVYITSAVIVLDLKVLSKPLYLVYINNYFL